MSEACQGDVADPRLDSVVAETVGFDGAGAEMRPISDDLDGVLGPRDISAIGVALGNPRGGTK